MKLIVSRATCQVDIPESHYLCLYLLTRSGINAAMLSKIIKGFFFAWIFLSCSIASFGQCSTTISTFPYNENFETSQGGWISGGVSNDWAWGNPSKPVITGAGSGSNCWITGGLTNSFYNYGERSWVQSPCFDFSTLTYPFISFQIFWETEMQYDGGNLQYSLNGGTSWTNVGAYNDPVSCTNMNWYNHSSINYLNTLATPRHGWTGSGSAGGSGGWVIAKHCLSFLAGESQVVFRFTFGAGTQQNNYDGLAFDDITIGESPPVSPAFSFVCLGTNKIRFLDQSSPCASSWTWNFNDPGSGVFNSSSAQNPVHIFSTSGSFNVTLTASNGCGATAFISNSVKVMNATAIVSPVSCFGGNDGSATIQVAGGGSPFSYQWNTIPVQTGVTSTNLSQGTYSYYVSGVNVCSDTNTVTINQPSQINHNMALVEAHCGLNNGVATIAVNGGTPPYNYSWSAGGGNVSTISNLAPGPYSVIVTDFEGCQVTEPFTITQPPPLTAVYQTQTATCGQQNGSAIVMPSGGRLPYAYSWFPNVSINQSANNLGGGDYYVTVTDYYGCIHHDTISIFQQQGVTAYTYSIPDTCSRGVGTGTVNVLTGTAPYIFNWSPGGYASAYVNSLSGGTYAVSVTDANGCSSAQSIIVSDYGRLLFSLGEDVTICPGNQMLLSAGDYSGYLWQDNSQQSTLLVNKKGLYWVTVTNSFGCIATDTIEVTEECLDDVLAPNAFTPDGDGKNDFFFALGTNVTSFSMKLFNRWGEEIFFANNMNAKWDGSYKGNPLQSDVFIWKINYSINNKPAQEKFGNVLLIR